MTPDEEACTWNKPEPLWLERDWAAADEEFKKMPPHIQKIITESIRAEEREKQRERCAKLIEGEPLGAAHREWTFSTLWKNQANDSEITKHCDMAAAAIRSGTDTDYVCVRREELEKVISKMDDGLFSVAKIKLQGILGGEEE